MTKAEWFDQLIAKRADRGYTPEENAAYRADLEAHYATVTDAEFAAEMERRGNR